MIIDYKNPIILDTHEKVEAANKEYKNMATETHHVCGKWKLGDHCWIILSKD